MNTAQPAPSTPARARHSALNPADTQTPMASSNAAVFSSDAPALSEAKEAGACSASHDSIRRHASATCRASICPQSACRLGRTCFQAGRDDEHATPARQVWEAADGDGEAVSSSSYPLLDGQNSWDVRSMLELELPGINHRMGQGDGGGWTMRMAHPDGSWARAEAATRREPPTVHQDGPRRLWDALEDTRDRLNTWGELPVYGSQVTITPDGKTTLSRGRWCKTTLQPPGPRTPRPRGPSPPTLPVQRDSRRQPLPRPPGRSLVIREIQPPLAHLRRGQLTMSPASAP